jgi:hypothetical protein
MRLKLKELIDAKILECPMDLFQDLSAAAYYLELPEGLMDEAEIKRLVAHHLKEAQAPAEWVSFLEI